jgi:ABC-type nitrate/sulfonate/bicarbonate transport system substrate-binding protein
LIRLLVEFMGWLHDGATSFFCLALRFRCCLVNNCIGIVVGLKKTGPMHPITLALDWTPNINHIGFFVAQEKGFYSEQGVEVAITDPSADNYQITPAKKVELGQADFALCPTESIISYQTKSNPFALIAVAAILQEDLSAIVVKADSAIQSPRDLDGKVYASYNARYEDEIVRQMIRNDGGTGTIKIKTPDKLGIWDTILDGTFDATWIFLNWEGVQGDVLDLRLRYFKMKDYQIPYSYSPVLVANENWFAKKGATYRQFLDATKQGFLFAQTHPEEAVDILAAHVPEKDANINLKEALALSAPHFGNEYTWGKMETETVAEFMAWIRAKKLEPSTLDISELVTNQFL